ncbi:alpha/beta hydrolase fold protein [Pochonia chlamydosporia 170]|uniref:Alpha/beta hydrolase fold protein n=1 Tax=Pochonia chlamydosporia 170 TaxID=1380566 RepID=A0A179FRL9_METCM|nr:alpha/beta hydrolase fold protein [Pochonia chlamydosporia 170]OAQ67840.1 alpha/beta hydrolase fold protein [Pochonia chlamydosporia 170]
MSSTTTAFIEANGAQVFYRQAGPTTPNTPTILLLHGFPSSSHQFRNLIPLLAAKGYRVIAPDLPGYGFTTVPPTYTHTFDNLGTTINAFTSALSLQKYAIYIFDYGAPTGLRLALENPDKVVAIISQNGNAYDEGFGAEFWAPIRKYWASGAKEDRESLRGLLEMDATKWQYTFGSPNADKVQPEAYALDQALMDRVGNKEIQLDLFYDYRNNVPLYPKFQEYFRTSKVPVLAIWGKNDAIFVAPGAEAFRKDVEKLEVKLLDAGHFAIETNEQEFADSIVSFFEKFNVF